MTQLSMNRATELTSGFTLVNYVLRIDLITKWAEGWVGR
jgi:hypothetical protein